MFVQRRKMQKSRNVKTLKYIVSPNAKETFFYIRDYKLMIQHVSPD